MKNLNSTENGKPDGNRQGRQNEGDKCNWTRTTREKISTTVTYFCRFTERTITSV